MSDDDREVARLWKINRTVHELVRDRGYEVAEEDISMELRTFKETFARNGMIDRVTLNFWTFDPNDNSNQIFIFYADEKAVSTKTVKRFLTILEEKKIGNGILIFSNTMTPSARKIMHTPPISQMYRLQDFAEADLLVNITHHKLVPTHELLSPEEKKMLLERYRLRETQLPRILLSDPVARYYGLKRGQVVKITRPSETSGRYASYRVAF